MIDSDYFGEMRSRTLIARALRFALNGFVKHAPDFVQTPHSKHFAYEQRFQKAYELAVLNGGFDYRIPWRVHQAIWCASNAVRLDKGDFVEFGTGKGFIMSAVLSWLEQEWRRSGKRAYLFDVFEKSSQSGCGDTKYDKYYAEDIFEVKKSFNKFSSVALIHGNVFDTVPMSLPKSISFAHVDLNSANAEQYVIKNIWPIMESGGIILLDDYANRGLDEQRSIHNSIFETFDRYILTTPAGQGIVIK